MHPASPAEVATGRREAGGASWNAQWTLLIPDYWPPPLNEVVMAHWSKVRKHKKRALQLAHVYALRSGGVPEFHGPVKVTITRLWGKGQRALDRDNLVGSVKPLVDALRAAKHGRNQRSAYSQGGLGIIAEDNPAALTLEVEQRKADDGRLATHILVEGGRVK